MKSVIVLVGFFVVSSLASSCDPRLFAETQSREWNPRIVGGQETNITKYPSAAVVLDFDINSRFFSYRCGGVIVNVRSVLTAADCVNEYVPARTWRVRLGSSYIPTGGIVHTASKIILHPDYNMCTRDGDIALIRSSTAFDYNDNVKRASIAGRNYIVPDDEEVWAIGWGIYDQENNPRGLSLQLREVSILSVNWETCRDIYKSGTQLNVSQTMMCTGMMGTSGRGHCLGDTGTPVYHNGVVVGIHVWDNIYRNCSDPNIPGVNMKVSSYIDWLADNI